MPAVFQIVSRATGMALAHSTSASLPDYVLVGADPPPTAWVVQITQNDQDSTQMWVLTSKSPEAESPEDFLIQPFGSPDVAIGVYGSEAETDLAGGWLDLQAATEGQVWRISRRLANPPYFFLLEASNDLLMDVPAGSTADDELIQIFTRTERTNQQSTFLPVFAELGNNG
jgi:hypothetical protein